MAHRSGFVNIIGNPNVGKSTLLNAFIGEKLSIITSKPQTTRHRIIAIVSGEDYQVVFSDTPGIIMDPNYKMQNAMNTFAYSALQDADILLFMTDTEEVPAISETLAQKINGLTVPKFLLINKIDLSDMKRVDTLVSWWSERIKYDQVCAVSAKEKAGTNEVLKMIIELLPEGPAYYPKDQFTDRSERFFVSEIIRENILVLYHQEIPYSCEVTVNSFKEKDSRKGRMIHIAADIIVNRKTQKSILIGKEGSAIKKLGTESRKGIEAFLEMPVFLDLHVKVKEKWRDDERFLKSYGYLQ